SPVAGPAAVTEDRRRAVVVGTGFGGSITALRLARAGVEVLVLERGIRWPTGPNADTFPRMFDPDRRAAWLSPTTVLTGSTPRAWKPYTGVLERVRGLGMDILCGSGVGGGSLVYHGMTLRQSAENFAACMPSSLDFDRFADDYYPRAEAVLKPAEIPDDVLASDRYRSSRLFLDRVAQAGLPGGFRVPLPLDWEFARKELRGEVAPAYTTGDVLYGANNGGKNTVDVTWLAAAEATGKVEVATLHVLRDIERDPAGKWVLHVERIDTDGVVRERIRITTDALFLGAGSAGTSRLLVKAKAKNLVPDLPDGVGSRWGNNGDRIHAWAPLLGESPGKLQGGPACVGVRDWPSPDKAVTVVHGGVPWPVDLRTTSIIGFGIVEPKGEFRYDPVRDDAVLHWSQAYDARLTATTGARIREIVGGNLLADLTNPTIDTSTFETTTYHPLGGATIGDVCDDVGRVRGQRGLYVTDGALIPGSTGAVNPSLTIAAMTERNMDTVVGDAGPVF
ncbi:MAG: GMC oxidoreductase, partial [Pseudonocardia sp.]|nr:GMC oxidoreductase [Pseudonocardia sp.]